MHYINSIIYNITNDLKYKTIWHHCIKSVHQQGIICLLKAVCLINYTFHSMCIVNFRNQYHPIDMVGNNAD